MKDILKVCTFAVSIIAAVSAQAGVNRFHNISPEGAEISSLAVDPRDPSTIYAASPAGIFKSVDAGESWALEPGSPADVSQMAIDSARSSTIFAGTRMGEVFRTSDGGGTWVSLAAWGENQPILALALDRARSEIVYALTPVGIVRSDDEGASWTPKTNGMQLAHREVLLSLATDPGEHSRLYAGTNFGLLVSNDRGESWSRGIRVNGIQHIAIDPTDSQRIYLGVSSYLMVSADGGKTWSDRYVGYVSHIVTDPNSSTIYILTRPSGSERPVVLESVDRGATWTRFAPALLDPRFLATVPGSSQVLYAGSRGDLFKTENRGASWRSVRGGLDAPHIYDVAIDPVDPMTLFASTPRGLLRSRDGGALWSDPKLDLPEQRFGQNLYWSKLTMGTGPSPALFASSPHAAMRSSDDGETWTAVAPGAEIRNIAVDPSNSSNVFAVLYQGLARSLDGGSSWTAVGVGQLPQGYYGWDGASIVVDPVTPTTVYAAGGGGITRSVDGGDTWVTMYSADFSEPYFKKVLIDPSNPARIYGLGFFELYRSDNSGNDWSLVHKSSGWPEYFTDIELDPRRPSRLYLSTASGVWKSEYRGDEWTWSEFSEGLPDQHVTSLSLDASGVVYAGTAAGLFVNEPEHEIMPGASARPVSLRTYAGNYVSANQCGGSFLDANATVAGPCETFILYDVDAGQLMDGDTIHLQSADGGFVVAEYGGAPLGGYAPVNANRGVAADWETFVVRRLDGAGPIRSGDSISLQSVGGFYVSADAGGGNGCLCDSRLSADRPVARTWETFVLVMK